jgi:type I restriction enzyme S subunit
MEVKTARHSQLSSFNSPFKQTEVGVIPEDWEVRPLGQLGSWKGGATPSMQNSVFWANGTVPWVSSGDVKSVSLSDSPMKITDYAVKNSSTTVLPKDSIIVVVRSGILRKYLPVARNTRPLAINQDIKALIPDANHVPSYLLHLLTWSGPKILATCLKSGTTVESIEFRWLKSFRIPLPPTKVEQEAITEVLSDADALIESLEQLIAKKRQIKQGAMQELLTGKKRLPGFATKPGYKQTEVGMIPEDWEVTTVGEISDVKTGPFGSALHEKDYVNNGTPIITVEHLGESGVHHTNLPMVSDADKLRLKAYSLRQGDIVFSRVGSVDRNALIKVAEDGWLFSGRLLRVRLKGRDTDAPYLSYHFHSEAFKQRVRDVAVGQTMASINTQILMGVEIILPPTKAEQTAIATILSDMDAEIAALEEKLAKARQLKQGMMQELLPGKTRLVESAK